MNGIIYMHNSFINPMWKIENTDNTLQWQYKTQKYAGFPCRPGNPCAGVNRKC